MPSASRNRNRSRSAWALLPALLLLLVGLAPVAAQAADAVRLSVLVVHTSDAEGGVADDANARKADSILGRQIRYNSLKVVKAEQRKVALNDTWKVALPNGKHFLVQALDVAANGVLVAVDLEGSAKVDARIKKNTPFVVGPQSHAGGSLSVILEASY